MYLIFLLFLIGSIHGMDKSTQVEEIIFSENKNHKPTSAVFIDENRVALTGWGECYILKLKEQERIPISKGHEYFSIQISPNQKMLAFIDDHGPHIYDLKMNNFPKIHQIPMDFTRLASISFDCNNDLIVYQSGYCAYVNLKQQITFSNQIVESDGLYISSNTISCHPNNNNFICCLNDVLYLINIEKSCDSVSIDLKRIHDNLVGFFCQQAQYDFSGKFIGIKTNDELVFVINSCEVLSGTISNPKCIGIPYKKYKASSFYPYNENIIVLLDHNSILEYWDHSVNKLICTQKMLTKSIDDTSNPPIQSVCFSPRGHKVLVIINGKLLLSDAPILPTNKTLLIYWILNIFFRNNHMPKDILPLIVFYIV